MASYFADVLHAPLGESEIDFLMLNVPPVCNYRCRKCFTNAGKRKIINRLSLKDWLRVISEARALGARNVSILGEGEPLIYESIRPVIRHIHNEGMIPMLATNAFELTPAMADFLCDHDATVGFSLDTLDEKEYRDFCRGNADLTKVLQNIAYARKRFVKTIKVVNGYKVFRFLLHMTVTPQNYRHFTQIRDFCGDDIFFDTQPLASVGAADSKSACGSPEDSYERLQRDLHAQYPPMVLSQTADGKEVCCLFNFGLAINHSGETMFDTHAIEPANYIGNVRDVPLTELIARTKKLRRYFLENFPSGYCPVRDHTYKAFLQLLTKYSIHELP